MPEGDTIARAAIVLRRALVGQKISRLVSRMPALRDTGLEGHVVTGIETRGKHLLIAFDDGRTLHTHLRMSGSWRVYAGSLHARSPVVAIETASHVAVLHQTSRGAPPIVRLLSPDALRRQPMLRALGPDLLAADFDEDEAVRRLLATRQPTVGEALLDQRSVAGIGNEYKSEVCFLCGVHPHRTPGSVDAATWHKLLSCTRELMVRNVRKPHPARVTRLAPGPAKWVYGRTDQRCLRCHSPIRRSLDGLDRRQTFFCPVCQH